MFPKPIVLTEAREGAELRLLGSTDQEALLESGEAGLPPGTPLVLTAPDGRFGQVELYAQVVGPARVPVGPARGAGATRVRWILVSSPRRRDHLARALSDVLGLQTEVTNEDPDLPVGRKLIFEVASCKLRLIRLETQPAPSLSAPPTDLAPAPARPAGERGLRVDPRELARVRVVGHAGQKADADTLLGRRTLGRREPRPLPVFRRAEARGTWSALGAPPQPMACGWIGLSHCVFVIPTLAGPELGAVIDADIPLDPIGPGAVRVSGPVSMLRIDESVERVVVELDLQGQPDLPEPYRQLVTYWELQNLGA